MEDEFVSEPSLGDKIIAFQFTAPSNALVVVEGIGHFQISNFDVSTLPFNPNQFLHFEPLVGVYQIGNGTGVVNMTPDQILKMKQYIQTLPVEMDLPFSCYDPNKSNLYMGSMPISEAKAKGYISVNMDCTTPVSKYNSTLYRWDTVKIIIMDDGSYIQDPSGVCDKCQLFLTEEEWKVFPKPTVIDPNAVLRYDFEDGTWIDIRTATDILRQYQNNVTSILLHVELTKYSEANFDYYSTINNPVLQNLVICNEQELAAAFMITESSVFESLKTKLVDLPMKVSTLSEMATKTLESNTSVITTLKDLYAISHKLKVSTIYWRGLPEVLLPTEQLTAENLELIYSEFKAWVRTNYGEKFAL